MPRTWVASETETETVAALLVEFRDWWGRDRPSAESFRRSVKRLQGDPNTDFLLGAEAEGEPALGVCQLRYRFGIWHAADDCWLEDLFVREAGRRSGIGRALVKAAVRRARDRGCARIELDANEANPAAIALYEGLGFSSRSDPPSGRNLLLRLTL
jgi:GNAT superfamily N-acetyltransferase